MKPILKPFDDHTYALLRIFSGAMFTIHGTGKILGWPDSKMRPPIASVGGVGGLIELICGVLITVGLATTIAAFIASGEMAVAYWWKHAPHGFIPNVNQGETAVLYCFIFLFLAANGSGIWSIDSLIHGGRAEPRPAAVT